MLIVFCLLMVVSLLACSVTKIKWIGYLGIAFALLGVLFWGYLVDVPIVADFLVDHQENIVLIVEKK